MLEVEKINNDFSALFEQGKTLLCAGQGETVNAKRDEAFSRFKALGGVPYKTEDYLYTNFCRSFRAIIMPFSNIFPRRWTSKRCSVVLSRICRLISY